MRHFWQYELLNVGDMCVLRLRAAQSVKSVRESYISAVFDDSLVWQVRVINLWRLYMTPWLLYAGILNVWAAQCRDIMSSELPKVWSMLGSHIFRPIFDDSLVWQVGVLNLWSLYMTPWLLYAAFLTVWAAQCQRYVCSELLKVWSMLGSHIFQPVFDDSLVWHVGVINLWRLYMTPLLLCMAFSKSIGLDTSMILDYSVPETG